MKRITIAFIIFISAISVFGQDGRSLDEVFDGFVETGYSVGAYYHVGLIYRPVDWAFVGGDVKTFFYEPTGVISYNPVDSDFHAVAGVTYSFVEVGYEYYQFNSNSDIINGYDPIMSLASSYQQAYVKFIVPENQYVNGDLTFGVSPFSSTDRIVESKADYIYEDILFNVAFNAQVNFTDWFQVEGATTVYMFKSEGKRTFNPFYADFFFGFNISYKNFSVGFRHYCSHPVVANSGEVLTDIYDMDRSYEEIYLRWEF